MTVADLKKSLLGKEAFGVGIALHDGGEVPPHFHVTEVGYTKKEFIDCGGTVRREGRCVLQIWVADDVDHRVTVGKMLKILEHGSPVLPTEDLEVELEHEYPVIARFPLESINEDGGNMILSCGLKHTDCLAKDVCGVEKPAGGDCGETEGCC